MKIFEATLQHFPASYRKTFVFTSFISSLTCKLTFAAFSVPKQPWASWCFETGFQIATNALRNSRFMKAVWEAQKKALRSHCEDVSPDNKVCCPNDPKKR